MWPDRRRNQKKHHSLPIIKKKKKKAICVLAPGQTWHSVLVNRSLA